MTWCIPLDACVVERTHVLRSGLVVCAFHSHGTGDEGHAHGLCALQAVLLRIPVKPEGEWIPKGVGLHGAAVDVSVALKVVARCVGGGRGGCLD
jgi:hypothetical protein